MEMEICWRGYKANRKALYNVPLYTFSTYWTNNNISGNSMHIHKAQKSVHICPIKRNLILKTWNEWTKNDWGNTEKGPG